jgi:targeting protein for Xklp2
MALDTGTVAAAAGIDEAYEFSAPRFFDFITEETEEAVRAAESWFEAARSHAPSRTYPRAAEAFFLVDRSLPPASASALISLAEFSLIFFLIPDSSVQP